MLNHADLKKAIYSTAILRRDITPANSAWYISATFNKSGGSDVHIVMACKPYSEHVALCFMALSVEALVCFENMLSKNSSIEDKIGECLRALDSFEYRLKSITHVPSVDVCSRVDALVHKFCDKPFSGNINGLLGLLGQQTKDEEG